MNLFQLVFKQMRQRALGTWLTLLSVLLGVALAVAIFLMRQAGSALFGQTEYGYDVLVGVGQGSPLGLTLNTVYHIDRSPGNVPYWVYEVLNNQNRPPVRQGKPEFNYNAHVRTAIPMAVGDTYKGRPIIGAPPKMFLSLKPLADRIDQLRTDQSELIGSVQNATSADAVAALAPQQAKIAGELKQIRQELKKITTETSPLMEQPDVVEQPKEATTQPTTQESDAPKPGSELLVQGKAEWRYGTPISFKADDAIRDSDLAAGAIQEKQKRQATKYQNQTLSELDAIYKAVRAENGPLEFRPDEQYDLAEGRVYHAWKFEAVIGSEVAEKAGLSLHSVFQATHGNPGPNEKPDIHKEKWEVVGIMKPTHTAADRCLYIPLISFYTIAEHESGQKAQEMAREGLAPKVDDDDDKQKYKDMFGDELHPDLPHEKGYINVDLPKSDWLVSAIMVKSRGGVSAEDLMYFVRAGGMHENVQAINPASVMRDFFDSFLSSSTLVLLVIAALVSVVAAIGILVSIYNSVAARNREIAILRALGATRGKVLKLICFEAGLIGLFGAILGVIAGHLLGGVGSIYLRRSLGQGFDWISSSPWEWAYLAGVVAIALLAGLVPAFKAYRVPVATNLVSG